ncbi:MAG: hypothetical protein ACM3X2_06545, partial [Pseudomonadota bacterium]
MSFLIISGLLDAGPSVARIFTLRDRGRSGSVNLLPSNVARGNNALRPAFNRLERQLGLAYSRAE